MFTKFKHRNFYFYIGMSLCGMFILQIIMLAIFNLTQIQYHMGYDASSYYLKAMEIAKQGTLLVRDWQEQTTLYWDSSVPIAALLYAVTGNIFVSYGIANCIIVAAIFIVFYQILVLFGLTDIAKLVCLNMVACIYIAPSFLNVNDIGYFSSTLSSGNWYGMKILIILMVIKMALDLDRNTVSRSHIIITEILLLISGISSGWYLLVTVILPLIAYYIMRMFVYNSFKEALNLKTAVLFVSAMFVMIGKMIAVYSLNFTSQDSKMILVGLADFWKNLGSIVLGFMELVSAFPTYSDQSVLTVNGMVYLLGAVVFLLCVLGFGYAVRYTYLNFRKSEKAKMYGMLMSVIFCNIGMFTILYTTYGSEIFESRYLTPLFFLLIISVGGFVDVFDHRLIFKQAGLLVICVTYFILNVYDDHLFLKSKNNYDILAAVSEEVKRLDVPVAYVYGNDLHIDGRNLRVIDKQTVYKNIHQDANNSALHWGDYIYYDDVAAAPEKNAIITTEQYYNSIPEYMRKNYTMQKQVDKYFIYTANTNKFDLKSGISDDYGLDYPVSPGFAISNGTIDNETGSFVGDGKEGYAIWGPNVNIEAGTYHVVLNYQILDASDQTADFIVSLDAGNLTLGTATLDREMSQAVLTVEIPNDAAGLEYKVYNYSGTVIRVDSFEIIRM